MDETLPGSICVWCFRRADYAARRGAYGLCSRCEREFMEMLGERTLRRSGAAVSLAGAFDVFRQLAPARLVETLRLAVAHHHEVGFGLEADAVWEACIAGYRTANRPYGASDAGFGSWLLDQEPGTFAAAGAARLVVRYISGDI